MNNYVGQKIRYDFQTSMNTHWSRESSVIDTSRNYIIEEILEDRMICRFSKNETNTIHKPNYHKITPLRFIKNFDDIDWLNKNIPNWGYSSKISDDIAKEFSKLVEYIFRGGEITVSDGDYDHDYYLKDQNGNIIWKDSKNYLQCLEHCIEIAEMENRNDKDVMSTIEKLKIRLEI